VTKRASVRREKTLGLERGRRCHKKRIELFGNLKRREGHSGKVKEKKSGTGGNRRSEMAQRNRYGVTISEPA